MLFLPLTLPSQRHTFFLPIIRKVKQHAHAPPDIILFLRLQDDNIMRLIHDPIHHSHRSIIDHWSMINQGKATISFHYDSHLSKNFLRYHYHR